MGKAVEINGMLCKLFCCTTVIRLTIQHKTRLKTMTMHNIFTTFVLNFRCIHVFSAINFSKFSFKELLL